MNKAFFTQKVLPHIIAVAVFLIVTVIFFHPIVFEGQTIQQNDINQGVGSAQEIIDFREETGDEALWTNSMFSGMPAYLINLYWSGEFVIANIQKVLSLFMKQPLRETFLAFISFYILLLVFRVRPYLAIAGALAYGLNTLFMVSVEAGHIWKVRAIAYMPLVLAGIHLTFRRKYILGATLTAVAMALEILANHLQITYYLFFLVVIYGIVQLAYHVKEKKLAEFFKIIAILVLAVLIGVASNFGRLWATYEYGQYSTRGASELVDESGRDKAEAGLEREYVFNWSSGVWETFTLLVPHLYGGASGQYSGKDSELSNALKRQNVSGSQIEQYERGLLGYWGDQPFTSGPVYGGVIMCLLFVIGAFLVDKRQRTWLLIAIAISIILSWGKNFPSINYLLYDILPGYNKFRSVTFTIFIALLCMNLTGFLGLEKLVKEGVNKETQKKLFIGGGIVAGLLILIAMFASPPALEGNQIPKVIKDAVEEDRLSIIRSDVMRSIFYVVVAFALIYFYAKKKISFGVFASLITVFVVLDLYLVNTRYINEENFVKPSRNQFLQPTEADQRILQDDSHYRVLNLSNPFNEARTSSFHSSIGGYHGAKMGRYQDLIEHQLQQEIQAIMEAGALSQKNTKMLSALNTKYIMAGQQANAVIQNPYANGNAWFVEEVKLVDTPNEEMELLDNIGLDSIAVIDQSKFEISDNKYNVSGNIELVDYQPNKLTYSSSNANDGLAVFSEIYYPKGWSATIDGEKAEILRTDYVLRALEVPSGDHEIVFTFAPDAYYVGNKVMFAANILMLLMILSTAFILYKRKSKPSDNL